jgi:hypothetical protein
MRRTERGEREEVRNQTRGELWVAGGSVSGGVVDGGGGGEGAYGRTRGGLGGDGWLDLRTWWAGCVLRCDLLARSGG